MNTPNPTLAQHTSKNSRHLPMAAICLLVVPIMVTGCNRVVSARVDVENHADHGERAEVTSERPKQKPEPQPQLAATIDFNTLDFSRLEELEKKEFELAQSGEDGTARLHYAWRGVITNLLAARAQVERQQKILTAADVLNINTITNGTQRKVSQQFFDRRGLANQYGSALNKWEHALQTIHGCFTGEMHKFQVSSQRMSKEDQYLSKLFSDPFHTEFKDRINLQVQICDAEQKIASQYNYAVGDLEMYYQRRQTGPNSEPVGGVSVQKLPWESSGSSGFDMVRDAREQFQERVAKLEEMKKAVLELRAQANQPQKPAPVASK